METHALLDRLAYLLTVKPNEVEIRQKGNLLRKSLFKGSPLSDLVHAYSGQLGSIQLLLLLQAIAKTPAIEKQMSTFDGMRLISILCSFLSQNPSYAVRNATIKCVSILAVKVVRPSSMVEFASQLPEGVQGQVLTEVPELLNAEDTLGRKWASDVFALAVRASQMHLVDGWIDFVGGQQVLESGLLGKITNLLDFEEVLLKCCTKPELSEALTFIIFNALTASQVKDRVVGCRLASSVVPHVGLHVVDDFTNGIRSIIAADTFDIDLYENVVGFLERVQIGNEVAFELVLLVSKYPLKVEKTPNWGNTDDWLFDVKQRFADVRSDMRKLLRRITDITPLKPVLSRFLSSSDWRLSESALHAVSAMCKTFSELEWIVNQVASSVNIHQTHRAVLCSLVVCMTTCMPVTSNLDQWVQLTLSILGTFDTVDAAEGWYHFRSKQDNACVVFLETLAKSQGSALDIHSFLPSLVENMDAIRMVLYHRDPFRQSRDIFLASVVDIVMQRHSSPAKVLPSLLQALCMDCKDLSIFISRCIPWKHLFEIVVLQRLDSFIAEGAIGSEALVALYAESITIQGLGKLFDRSASLSGSIERWIVVADAIVRVHGRPFVVRLSAASRQVPLPAFNVNWFTHALMSVPIDDSEFHVQWISRICNNTRFDSEIFRSCMQYVKWVLVQLLEGDLRAVLQPMLLSTAKLLTLQACTCNCADAMASLSDVCVLIGTDDLKRVYRVLLKSDSPEIDVLIGFVSVRSWQKVRPLLKKFSLALH